MWQDNSENADIWLKYLPSDRLMKYMYNETFNYSEVHHCPNKGRGLQMIIIVHSAPKNFGRRLRIRQTWGFYKYIKTIKIMFFIGTSQNQTIEEKLQRENKMFNDIFRFNFTESYQSLPLKTVAMLEWVLKKCEHVRFVCKIDDDIYINIPKILKWSRRIRFENKIYGYVYTTGNPDRTQNDKYYISEDEYSGDSFPSFVIGGNYMMWGDIVSDLYYTALESPFLKFEDMFLTGVVASKLGARIQHVEGFHLYINHSQNVPVVEKFNSIILTYNFPLFFDIWGRQFSHYRLFNEL